MIDRRTVLASALFTAAAPLRALAPVPATPGCRTPRVIRFPALRSAFVSPRDVTVWLPNGYVGCTCRHPVVYMNDGEQLIGEVPGGSPSDRPAASIEAAVAHYAVGWPAIIVAISSTADRTCEYGPAAPLALLSAPLRARALARYGGVPMSDQYLRFIVEELKPLVDRSFRTLPRHPDTMIVGSGMGGLVSLYALTQYPGIFGAAACFAGDRPLVPATAPQLADAPAHWARDLQLGIRRYLSLRFPRAGFHRLYVDGHPGPDDVFDRPFRTAISQALAAKHYVEGGDLIDAALADPADYAATLAGRADRAMALLLGRYYRHPPWETD